MFKILLVILLIVIGNFDSNAQGSNQYGQDYYELKSPIVAKGFLFNSYYSDGQELIIEDLIAISQFRKDDIAKSFFLKGRKSGRISTLIGISGLAMILAQMSGNYIREIKKLNQEPSLGALGSGLMLVSLSFKINSKNQIQKGLDQLNAGR